MTDAHDSIRQRLRDLERSFHAFERGERSRLYESRDVLTALNESVESTGDPELVSLCELSSRILGVLLMEGSLNELRTVEIVREILGHVERRAREQGEAAEQPGGVFHVVNAERLGEMLVRKGAIAPHQLEKALLLQRVSKGKRVGEVLIAMNAIDQRTLDAALEGQRGETRREETRRGHTSRRAELASASGSIPPLPMGEDSAPASIPLAGDPPAAGPLPSQRDPLPPPPPVAAPPRDHDASSPFPPQGER